MKLEYQVDGMSCNSCRMSVIEEVGELHGVETVEVVLETGRVQVSGSELDDAAIQSAIVEAGYRPSPAV